jgi:hypothetical protein
MSSSPSPKSSASAANSAGAKIFVTAASLATVVGGWAALSLQQSAENTQASVEVPDDASQVVLNLPPLPTLVPEPSSIPTNSSPSRPVSAPLTFSPYSTPAANPTVATVPASGKKNTSSKESSGKAESEPPKDPVAHTGSSK